jgi:hypothetical protein
VFGAADFDVYTVAERASPVSAWPTSLSFTVR